MAGQINGRVDPNSPSEPLRSHVALTSAWDATSQRTIFVGVETGRAWATQGTITVYPGFEAGSNTTLAVGEQLSTSNVDIPSDSYTTLPDFGYTLRTDTAPGIACADNRLSQTFNCMLAWQDSGIPDGRILYTYFQVNPTTGDIFWQGDVWVRGTAYTVGNVAAAFFDGEFWLAWKTLGPDPDVAWTHRPASGSLYSGSHEMRNRKFTFSK